MAENFLSKAMADGQVFVKLVGLVTKLSQFKLQIRRKRTEKERLLKEIGIATISLWHQNKRVDGPLIFECTRSSLFAAQELDAAIAHLEAQIIQLKADFKPAQADQGSKPQV